jgi:carboxyl-terminal processing protease
MISIGLVLVFLVQAQSSLAPSGHFGATGRELIQLVSEHFYDREHGEVWRRANADYWSGSGAPDGDAFVQRTRAALAKLNASHTAYFTPDDLEYWGLLSIFSAPLNVAGVSYESIGIDIDADGFLRVVFAGGPAASAGLQRGDKILLADGLPFHPIRSFRGKAEREVVLAVQRAKGAQPVELGAVPHLVDPRAEWLQHQKQGARLITRNNRDVLYVPMFSCAGPEFEELLRIQIAEHSDADALIIDMRNGWGGCSLNFVSLFDPRVPEMAQIDRRGKRRDIVSVWKKPLILLINERSKSSKELVAYAVKKHQIGTLVGMPTPGAVLGGRCFLLSDRSLLYLAVLDILVDGRRLEGIGVKPDVEVEDHLPFANGADPQLEKALDLASK